MKMHIAFSVALILIFLQGCREADVNGPGIRNPGSGTYVVNEGGFAGGGNLSFFNPATGTIANDVVVNADNWLFPNDIHFFGGKMYIVVNGVDRIDVLDPASDSVLKSIAFSAGTGPGFLVESGNLLYSANYDGTVCVIDPMADSIVGNSARIVGFPGDILVVQGKIFVSDLGAWPDTGKSIKVLDASTLALVDSVVTGGAPARMTMASGKIYAGTSVSGKVWRVDPVTLAVEDSCDVGSAPGDLAADGIYLYVLTADAVERIRLNIFERDSAPLIPRGRGIFNYAMERDDATGEIYVSTIVTAGGSGEIAVFASSGIVVQGGIAAGIFPGAFGFYRADAR